MSLSRRRFVALGAGALAATGCDRIGIPNRDEILRWTGHMAAPPLTGPLEAPSSAEVDAASHALNRLTFGARPGDYARVARMGVAAFMEEQLAPEKIEDAQCERLIRHEFEELGDPESHLFPRGLDPHDAVSKLFPTVMDSSTGKVGDLYEYPDKALLQDLTRAAILRAVVSRRQLYEVMVSFWSDHFNIDPSKGECKWLKAADDREVIRKHALGRFVEMLRASALSPAMLWYLDGRVNQRKDATEKPNENYARELMELHTMGVHGGYTQQDVMEVARCLTGWTVRDRKRFRKGKVEFHPSLHDDGEKTVLGQTMAAGGGMRDLDQVLEIVARHPSTARFIATKLCRQFIADQPPAAAIAATAQTFQTSEGDIRATLRTLFATPEFAEARGAKFKRPFHFVVSALRATNASTDGKKPVIDALLQMGHAPFHYPTPDGYPAEAKHWTGTLLWRWNFALALCHGKLPGTHVRLDELRAAIGGDEGVVATCLGRKPSPEELQACTAAGTPVALALASPAFQRC